MREWTKREWEKTHSKAWYPAKPYDHDDCVKVSWRYAKEAGVNDLHKAALEALWVMEKFRDQAPLDWYYDKEYEALLSALNRQHTHSDNCWSWGPAHYDCALRKIGQYINKEK
jgi:hypothetical protein